MIFYSRFHFKPSQMPNFPSQTRHNSQTHKNSDLILGANYFPFKFGNKDDSVYLKPTNDRRPNIQTILCKDLIDNTKQVEYKQSGCWPYVFGLSKSTKSQIRFLQSIIQYTKHTNRITQKKNICPFHLL